MTTAYMKQISFTLLASASLCFAQGSQPIPAQNRSDQQASASREQSTNPSSFVGAALFAVPEPGRQRLSLCRRHAVRVEREPLLDFPTDETKAI
jgi:hypothetical protein